MSFKEYKCPRCGRVHAAISLADAEDVVSENGDISPFLQCFGCGAPSTDFVPAGADDELSYSSVAVVVVPDALH
jgi:hypothetical protein